METKTVLKQDVRDVAYRMLPGYYKDVFSYARLGSITATTFDVSFDDWLALDAKYRAPQPPPRYITRRFKTVQAQVIYDWHLAGDWLAIVIQRLTGAKASATCGCNGMRKKMNGWGWWGCALHHKREIARHLTVRAKGLARRKIKDYQRWSHQRIE